MPWIMQMIGFAVMLVGIAVALWVSAWVLLFLLVVGFSGVIWAHVRDYLVAKGILNPPAARAARGEDAASVTIVEGDFTRVETPPEKISND